MPGKKKKYNARFPPARIKKIMQTDEEVGKVAAAVPVIISRALELFAETLLARANDVTARKGARTLTPSHLKLCIETERRFDFLREMVTSVPELQQDDDYEPEGEMMPLQPSRGKPRGRGGLLPLNLSHSNSEKSRSVEVSTPVIPSVAPLKPALRGKKRGRPPKIRNGVEHGSGPPVKLGRLSSKEIERSNDKSESDHKTDSTNGHEKYPLPGRLGVHVPPLGRVKAGQHKEVGRQEDSSTVVLQETPASAAPPFQFIYRPDQGELTCGQGTVTTTPTSLGSASRTQPISRSMSLPGAPRLYPDPRAQTSPTNLPERQPLDLKIPGFISPLKHSAGIISPGGLRSKGIIPPAAGSAGVMSPGGSQGHFYQPAAGASVQESYAKKTESFPPSPSHSPPVFSSQHRYLPSTSQSAPASPSIPENMTAVTIEPQLATATPASDVMTSSDDVSKESTNGEEAVSLPHIESGSHSFIRSLSSAPCRGPSSAVARPSTAVAKTSTVAAVTTVKRDLVIDEDYD